MVYMSLAKWLGRGQDQLFTLKATISKITFSSKPAAQVKKLCEDTAALNKNTLKNTGNRQFCGQSAV